MVIWSTLHIVQNIACFPGIRASSNIQTLKFSAIVADINIYKASSQDNSRTPGWIVMVQILGRLARALRKVQKFFRFSLNTYQDMTKS